MEQWDRGGESTEGALISISHRPNDFEFAEAEEKKVMLMLLWSVSFQMESWGALSGFSGL